MKNICSNYYYTRIFLFIYIWPSVPGFTPLYKLYKLRILILFASFNSLHIVQSSFFLLFSDIIFILFGKYYFIHSSFAPFSGYPCILLLSSSSFLLLLFLYTFLSLCFFYCVLLLFKRSHNYVRVMKISF